MNANADWSKGSASSLRYIVQESRGRELPGTHNPLIVAELFSKQCIPWQDLVRSLLERVFHSASKAVDSILRNVADSETVDALLKLVLIWSELACGKLVRHELVW